MQHLVQAAKPDSAQLGVEPSMRHKRRHVPLFFRQMGEFGQRLFVHPIKYTANGFGGVAIRRRSFGC